MKSSLSVSGRSATAGRILEELQKLRTHMLRPMSSSQAIASLEQIIEVLKAVEQQPELLSDGEPREVHEKFLLIQKEFQQIQIFLAGWQNSLEQAGVFSGYPTESVRFPQRSIALG